MQSQGELTGRGFRFAVVASRWNEEVTDALVASALDALEVAGAEGVVVVRVPGAWEVPVVVADILRRDKPNAVVALGCVLQGETSHAGLLASTVCDALMELMLETGIPITWGIVTADTLEVAMERRHRGREAAMTAIEMANLTS